jgi:MoxR-like ATPase
MAKSFEWSIFTGSGAQTDFLKNLPPAAPWRFPGGRADLGQCPWSDAELESEAAAAKLYSLDPESPEDSSLIVAVNLALYLRKPLLLVGDAGTGKSRLISAVSHELKLGPVLRWNLNSRSSVDSGVCDYDAVERFARSHGNNADDARASQYVTLGPLGLALGAPGWPRALLIDELDKADVDFPDDLLNLIDSGSFSVREIVRSGEARASFCPRTGRRTDRDGSDLIPMVNGVVQCGPYPFIIMTANEDMDFSAAFKRRCIEYRMPKMTTARAERILSKQIASLGTSTELPEPESVRRFVAQFAAAGDGAFPALLETVVNAYWLIELQQAAARGEAGTSTRQEILRRLGLAT